MATPPHSSTAASPPGPPAPGPDPSSQARPRPARSGPPQRSPLGSVLAFTFLNSLGTGAVTTGLFFLTKAAFDFGPIKNFLLAALMGAAYIAGAAGAAPGLRLLARRSSRVSTRGVVATLMLALAALCALPLAAGVVTGIKPAPEWSAWVFGLVYLPLTGILWPIVESYLSGGRRGQGLRKATGAFNICWSGALVVAYWAMAPLLEGRALLVILGLGVIHLICLPIGWRMGQEPGRHLEEDHEPHPGNYPALLRVFRILLPMSYVVLASLAPYLPDALDRLGVAPLWAPVVASIWLLTRVLTFWGLERWQGWHGRWSIPVVATTLLLLGFALAVLSPLFGPMTESGLGLGLPAMVLGLIVFGIAHATIYCGALYYGLEVGQAQVDAGGWHEALIGVGYTAGPLLGLGVALILGPNHPTFQPALLGIVAGVALVLSLAAATQAHAEHRRMFRAEHGDR